MIKKKLVVLREQVVPYIPPSTHITIFHLYRKILVEWAISVIHQSLPIFSATSGASSRCNHLNGCRGATAFNDLHQSREGRRWLSPLFLQLERNWWNGKPRKPQAENCSAVGLMAGVIGGGVNGDREGRGTHGRRSELEKWGTPQSEELWRVHAVLNGVLLLLVDPAHVDDLRVRRRVMRRSGAACKHTDTHTLGACLKAAHTKLQKES